LAEKIGDKMHGRWRSRRSKKMPRYRKRSSLKLYTQCLNEY